MCMEHNSWKNEDIRISSQYAHLHIMSLLATKFLKIMFCSFREVAFTNCFDFWNYWTSWNLVVIMDIICKCAFDRKFRSLMARLLHKQWKNLSVSAHIPHAPTYWTLKRDNSSMEHNSWKNQDIRISSQYAQKSCYSKFAKL
jgi:hypothetical protein